MNTYSSKISKYLDDRSLPKSLSDKLTLAKKKIENFNVVITKIKEIKITDILKNKTDITYSLSNIELENISQYFSNQNVTLEDLSSYLESINTDAIIEKIEKLLKLKQDIKSHIKKHSDELKPLGKT